MADKFITANTDSVTNDDIVISNSDIDAENIAPCNHQEADTRMFFHAKHAAVISSKNIAISSSDTDGVVLAISFFIDLHINELWITFGKGKDIRWIPVHQTTRALGPRCIALPFFHAFTGCDAVSAFVGKGKKSALQTWNVFEAATEVFTRLSGPVSSFTDDELSIFEEFVVIMYDRESETNKFDEARLDLFARKQRQYNAVPPSSAALVQHVKRSVLQAGHTWGQALSRIQNLPAPSNWGWKKENDVWVPHSTSLASFAASF